MTSDDTHLKAAMIQATGTITAAYVSHHGIELKDLDNVVSSVFRAISSAQVTMIHHQGANPLVTVQDSITPEYLICLEDGKRLKMLKRYLKTNYGLTPEEYRKRWNLPTDYPMVAPNYAKRRSELAKDIGLGKQSIKQRKQAAFGKFKSGLLPGGKGKLRIVKSTDIMMTQGVIA